MKKFLLIVLFLLHCSLRAEVDVIAAGEVKQIEYQDGKKIVHIDLYTWWKGDGYVNQFFSCNECGIEAGKTYLVYLEADLSDKLSLVEGLPIEEGFSRFAGLGWPSRSFSAQGGMGAMYLGYHNGLRASWLDWFGLLFEDDNDETGNLYHLEHGWLAQAPEPIQRADFDAWFWDFSKGDWLYTGSGIYPFMFSAEESSWLYYFEGGTPEQRWFYSFKNEAFESVVSE